MQKSLERECIQYYKFLKIPVARIGVEFICTPPDLVLGVEQPDALVLLSLIDAVGKVLDVLIFL